MMDATSGTGETKDEQKDLGNNPDGTQITESPAVNNEVGKAADTNKPSTNNEATQSTSDTKPEEHTDLSTPPDSSNQEGSSKSTDINEVSTSSDPNESEGENKVNTPAPSKQTDELVNESLPDNVEVTSASDEQKLKESEKTNTLTNDDSTSADGEQRQNNDSSSNQTTSKKSNNSKVNSNDERFETANIQSISYKPDEVDLLQSLFDNKTKEKLIDRLLGCAYGQALGDAYGLSTEFEDRHDVDRKYLNCPLIPFPNYVLTGHNRRWTRGDWTDDTDQWILILLTLMFHNGDEKVFAKKLTDWIYYGYPELGDYGGMGLGANVSQVVRSPNYINDPLTASENVWERGNRQAAPNGAVMRCSASAFVHFNDVDKVRSTTELMCKTTHFDPRCIASCLAVCLAVTYLLREEVNNDDIEALISRVQQETIDIIGDRFSESDRDLFKWFTDKRTPEELNLDEPGKIGYTYKCLASGFYGLRSTESFEQTLHNLIQYGGDADTNGAVCGTLYGARHGYRALPYKWLREMPNKKWLDQILIKCLEKLDLIGNEPMDISE